MKQLPSRGHLPSASVVSIGHSGALFPLFLTLEYILTLPPHYTHVIENSFSLAFETLFCGFGTKGLANGKMTYDVSRMRRYIWNILRCEEKSE